MNTATDSRQANPQRAARQQAVVAALQAVLPAHAILYTLEDTTPYECDGLTAYRERPLVVALPETYEQVQAVRTAAQPKFSEADVKRRIAELDDLLERGLILPEFHARKVREYKPDA